MKNIRQLVVFFLTVILYSCAIDDELEDELINNDNQSNSSWQIENGLLKNNTKLDVSAYSEEAQKQLWELFANTIPLTEFEPYINLFQIESDGIGGTLASVEPTDETSLANWLLSIDPADAYASVSAEKLRDTADFYQTLIHEYAHVMSLNDTQVEVSKFEFNIETRDYSFERFEISEGLSKADSYLNLYVREFWSTELLKKSDKNEMIENETVKEGEVFDFYQGNQEQFVNDYAATNPVEDLAETWSFFVILDKQTDSSEVRFKKINFFYQFEELVRLRTSIRENLPTAVYKLKL